MWTCSATFGFLSASCVTHEGCVLITVFWLTKLRRRVMFHSGEQAQFSLSCWSLILGGEVACICVFAVVHNVYTYPTGNCFFHLYVISWAYPGAACDSHAHRTLKLWRCPQPLRRAVFTGGIPETCPGVCHATAVFIGIPRPQLPCFTVWPFAHMVAWCQGRGVQPATTVCSTRHTPVWPKNSLVKHEMVSFIKYQPCIHSFQHCVMNAEST